MAKCTPYPFIQVFKPVLLLALDDYFSSTSQDCLGRLFDAINSMDLSGAPTLTRPEKLIMRHSERKDVFIEKFTFRASDTSQHPGGRGHHRPSNSFESHTSFDEGIMIRTSKDSTEGRDRANSETSGRTTSVSSVSHHNGPQHSPFRSFVLPRGQRRRVGEEGGLVEHAASPGCFQLRESWEFDRC